MSKRALERIFLWWNEDKSYLVGIYTDVHSLVEDMRAEDSLCTEKLPDIKSEGAWISYLMHETDQVIEMRSLNTPNQNDLFLQQKHRKILCKQEEPEKHQFSNE